MINRCLRELFSVSTNTCNITLLTFIGRELSGTANIDIKLLAYVEYIMIVKSIQQLITISTGVEC